MALLATDEWFWEGNVVEIVCEFLISDGWTVVLKADTSIKQQGVDIHCEKDGVTRLIEVKGYPSQGYRDPSRAGEKKRTNPRVQAKHWYGAAILAAIRLQAKFPEAEVMLAFPEFPRYLKLVEETKLALKKLGIKILMAKESGDIELMEFN